MINQDISLPPLHSVSSTSGQDFETQVLQQQNMMVVKALKPAAGSSAAKALKHSSSGHLADKPAVGSSAIKTLEHSSSVHFTEELEHVVFEQSAKPALQFYARQQAAAQQPFAHIRATDSKGITQEISHLGDALVQVPARYWRWSYSLRQEGGGTFKKPAQLYDSQRAFHIAKLNIMPEKLADKDYLLSLPEDAKAQLLQHAHAQFQDYQAYLGERRGSLSQLTAAADDPDPQQAKLHLEEVHESREEIYLMVSKEVKDEPQELEKVNAARDFLQQSYSALSDTLEHRMQGAMTAFKHLEVSMNNEHHLVEETDLALQRYLEFAGQQ